MLVFFPQRATSGHLLDSFIETEWEYVGANKHANILTYFPFSSNR